MSTLLDSFRIAMSQTSALCKPIATASSASNCCKCMVKRIMILPCCPPQKRTRNGNHLRLQPKIGQTRNGSSPQTRLHSPASKSRKTIPNHSQCIRPGRVSRGTPVTHTLAQCFYKYKGKGASPPTTSLLTKKANPPPRTKFAGSTSVKPAASTSRQTSKFIKFSQGSSSATPKKDPSEIDCWTCGQKGHYSSDCPSNTKSKWELRWPQI